MAGFVLFAVVRGPVGGWLSDRLGAPRVLTVVLAVVAACAAVQAFAPDLATLGTAAPGRRGDGQGGRPFHCTR